MGEHSPTPWEVSDAAFWLIYDANGAEVVNAEGVVGEELSDRIVHAVNLHDEMVDVLKAADRYFTRYHEAVGRAPASVMTANKIRTALAKATPTPRKVPDPTGSER